MPADRDRSHESYTDRWEGGEGYMNPGNLRIFIWATANRGGGGAV